jgi:hypothetical protein
VEEKIMQIIPQELDVEIKHHICPHHKNHPDDTSFAGCTCSSSYSGKVKKKAPRNDDPVDLLVKI